MKVQPLHGEEIAAWKALITLHKVIRSGHPNVLKESMRETGFLESLSRSVSGDGVRGYGQLIRTYVNFILSKLEYHSLHPEFNGTFEYEDYISLKGTDDPNEGYETIMDLMVLQDKVDSFQKLIFKHFRPSSNNECRIAALVPLVEESYGIYKFIMSMLIAMHKVTNQVEALSPLRQRFNAQHYGLLKFYYECSNLKYLTSLITVPKLPQEPPNLMGGSGGGANAGALVPVRRPSPPRERTPIRRTPSPEPEALNTSWMDEQQRQLVLQRQQFEFQQQQEQQRLLLLQQQQQQQRMSQQHEFEEMQRLQRERERLAQEALMREQMQRQQQGRSMEFEQEMLRMRGQAERDRLTIEQYDRRIRQLEGELSQFNLNNQARDNSKDSLIKSLQDQIAMWKAKYEQLAKLYQQLRKEHLELLNRFQESQDKVRLAEESIERVEKMQADMRAKNMQLADMIRERDQIKNELERYKNSRNEELARMKQELMDANARVADLGKNKSAEMGGLLDRFNKERDEFEQMLSRKQGVIDQLMNQLDVKKGELEKMMAEKDEEIAILQLGMDQSLLALNNVQQSTHDNSKELQAQLDRLRAEQLAKLNRILDSILMNCITKVDESIYELESPSHMGNMTATPEYALQMIEKTNDASTDFAIAYTDFVKDPSDSTTVINTATNFAQIIAQLLHNTKGVSRLAADDDTVDVLSNSAKGCADSSQRFFTKMISSNMGKISNSQKPMVVAEANRDMTEKLAKLTVLTESLIPKQAEQVATMQGNIADMVENEMQNAARIIEDAAARLAAMMERPMLTVHSAILDSAMAMTNAIAHLIKCATDSQQEIVAHGRGRSTNAEFYKRNNRWTEGLISAAKAVAMATNLLVETADGVISGTHSFEQLIVASNEVAAATAQLVAASRVKAITMSKTQDKLEDAAKAVNAAARALVKAVKAIAAREMEDKERLNISDMSTIEFKRKEMEKQVEILKLEKELSVARKMLGEIRRLGYHDDEGAI